ncbi:MAG: hypothetical protein LBS90_00485 [Oscillospiraceae bacterium]|jgi:hypothetical protein|nr:hypothetical protein [Oscillospiraceae bacterium]
MANLLKKEEMTNEERRRYADALYVLGFAAETIRNPYLRRAMRWWSTTRSSELRAA